jgi:hypothetical protein
MSSLNYSSAIPGTEDFPNGFPQHLHSWLPYREVGMQYTNTSILLVCHGFCPHPPTIFGIGNRMCLFKEIGLQRKKAKIPFKYSAQIRRKLQGAVLAAKILYTEHAAQNSPS